MLFIVSQCHFSNTVVMGTTVHIDGRHDNGLPNNLDDFYGIRMTKGSKIMLDYWSFFQMIFWYITINILGVGNGRIVFPSSRVFYVVAIL